jgi:DNA-binding CsgD family transcriptional regulator
LGHTQFVVFHPLTRLGSLKRSHRLAAWEVARMVERIGVSESDLRRLMDLVDRARCGQDGEYLPTSVLLDLADLLGCDEVDVQVMDPYARELAGLQTPQGLAVDSEHLISLFWPAFWEAYSYSQQSGDFVSVTRLSDHLPGVQLGRKWARLNEAEGANAAHRFSACVPFPPNGTIDRRLLLWRHDGLDFSDRAVLLLSFLRPHLALMLERQRAARANVPSLTDRQREILRLVGGGSTNGQIAHALNLSEATVRKHLENTYARLGVNSRTEALAKTSGFLAEPPPPQTPFSRS